MKRAVWVILALAFVLAVWGCCFYVTWNAWAAACPSIQNLGLFGDSFGTINALFSGLAFAGVVIALAFQAHDGKSQREEFRLQARINACVAIIDAEKILSDYYDKAAQREAPPPIFAHPRMTWTNMADRSMTRILEMSVALEEDRKLLITNTAKEQAQQSGPSQQS